MRLPLSTSFQYTQIIIFVVESLDEILLESFLTKSRKIKFAKIIFYYFFSNLGKTLMTFSLLEYTRM